jgi:sodium/hydrogen exchanger-like protein 6/7
MLLIVAFCTSYTMQQRKITAIHETVVSIFGGALLPSPFMFYGS